MRRDILTRFSVEEVMMTSPRSRRRRGVVDLRSERNQLTRTGLRKREACQQQAAEGRWQEEEER